MTDALSTGMPTYQPVYRLDAYRPDLMTPRVRTYLPANLDAWQVTWTQTCMSKFINSYLQASIPGMWQTSIYVGGDRGRETIV
jgi:hypothetical protein